MWRTLETCRARAGWRIIFIVIFLPRAMLEATNQPAAAKPLRAIIVEDAPDDVALLLHALRRAGYVPEYAHVQTREELARALRTASWDVVLSDYALPGFSGLLALREVAGFDPDIPFIIISGNIGDDVAVATMKAGAHDYVIKDNLIRLGPAIERELRDATIRRARRSNERALHESRQRVQNLSKRLLETQEAERRHLARELHDEIGQSLTAIKLSVEALARRVHDAATSHLADEIAITTGHVLDQVRQISLDLRPPQLDDLGLRAALQWLVARHSRDGGPAIELQAPEIFTCCGTQMETASFRIAQEALTNALRHSNATEIRIVVETRDGFCCIEICDDGHGFDVEGARTRALRGSSLGLLSMHERATLVGGELEIASGEGDGTRIRFCVPLDLDGCCNGACVT